MLLSLSASLYRPVELPSWCPNFNSPPKDLAALTSPAYQAGFLSAVDRIQSSARPTLDASTIELHGFRIDCVREVVGSADHCYKPHNGR